LNTPAVIITMQQPERQYS